jgi:Lhr-like helicase
MDDCSNCHTLTARLDNAEAARRSFAADLMAAHDARYRSELAQVRADRGFNAWSDAEPGSPEGEQARRELAAALMDIAAARRQLKRALVSIEDRYADLADALTVPVS